MGQEIFGGLDVSLPDERRCCECCRGFEMSSLANAIFRVLRMKLFLFQCLFAGKNKLFSHDKEDCPTLE